ncbi:MAG TPA: HlyD family type I secretion periplasmic adaptor subunit [Alphaproteobacteria bacterium]|nr:HlyD family type I secretion periplasmic adaptor subunit [Alphaproteobacteria bacterium]
MSKKRFDLLDNPLTRAVGISVSHEHTQSAIAKAKQVVNDGLNPDTWEDGDFMDDVRQATMRGAHPASVLLFWVMGSFMTLFLLWAGFAKLDEVARGQGLVIPGGKVQAVGSAVGGVIQEILVKPGDVVQPGQELVRFDPRSAAAGLGEKEARRYYLMANVARLDAELNDKPLEMPEDVKTKTPQIASETETLYTNRKAQLDSTTKIFKEQAEQKQQELNDARTRTRNYQEAYNLAKEELDKTRPYVESGAVAKIEVLRLERAMVDARRELNTAQLSIPSTEAGYREAQGKLEEAVLKYKNEARDDLGKMRTELAQLGESVQGDISKVEQSVLKSPIRAEVKDVLVNTVGQAVQANANIVELVPLDEGLMIEAQVKPQDIAFIRVGLPAMVKLSAYDYSIYGGLKGVVASVSADSFTTEKGETYYKVQVRADKTYLMRHGEKLPIKSGMVATVDVLTGKRTILQYLLKPITKAREAALTER